MIPILMVEAVDAQRVDTLEKKLRRALLPARIVRPPFEVEHQESNSQVLGRGGDDRSLKSD